MVSPFDRHGDTTDASRRLSRRQRVCHHRANGGLLDGRMPVGSSAVAGGSAKWRARGISTRPTGAPSRRKSRAAPSSPSTRTASDPDPSPLLGNITASLRHRARIRQPMVRAGWLDRGPGADGRRGAEPFVPVSWPTAIDLLSRELRRVYDTHGGEAVYGGSYGWASAGRFHHAQSQLHRFLNCLGGFVRGEHSYSNGALTVIMPHVVGDMRGYLDRAMAWSVIERHTELFVCFGGIPLKNTMVSPGGASRHPLRDHLRAMKARGAEFVLLSPMRDDLPEFVEAEWLPVVPGTDVAVMLGLAHTLIDEQRCDRQFLSRYCAGFERFEGYLRGAEDGSAKTPEWAERLSGIPAETVRTLARRMAAKRTLINANWSLQRVEHGEQAPWMVVTLAAMLGQIGLPGGGFGSGYGSLGYIGRPPLRSHPPALPQRPNPVRAAIPFARLADMLLEPGEPFDFNGQRLVYPRIRLIYWCGGNPFHHHQDLSRLRRALATPDTIVVHDPFWTPMARHADVVLPATVTLERNDIGGSPNDPCLIAMRQVIEPHAEARTSTRSSAISPRRSGSGLLHGRAGRDGVAPAPLRGLAREGRSPRRAGVPGLRRVLGGRIPRGDGCRPRPGPAEGLPGRPGGGAARDPERDGSRSSRRPSRASATRTALAIQPGSSPWSGSARRWPSVIRSTSSRTTRRRACTASSMSERSARPPRCRDASRSACTRPTRRTAGSGTGTWCESSTSAGAAWRARSSPTPCVRAWSSSRRE